MNHLPIVLLISAIVASVPAIVSWRQLLQQQTNLLIGMVAVLSLFILFALLAIIAVLWTQNVALRSGIGLRSEMPTPYPFSATRPTLYGIQPYSELFHAMESSLSEDELKDLAFDVNLDLEQAEGDTKSAMIRYLILALDRQNRVGHIYRWLGENRPHLEIR